jgi:hypothetical protein
MNESHAPVPPVPAAAPYPPAAAGASPPGPKTIGQVLDRTYRLTRGYFKLLVGIAAIPVGEPFLFAGSMLTVMVVSDVRRWPKPVSSGLMDRYFTGVVGPVFLVFCLLSLAIFSIYLATASFASTNVDSGIKVTVRDTYGLAWRRAGRYLWLLVLMHLCAFLPLVVIDGAVLPGARALLSHAMAAAPAFFSLAHLQVLFGIAILVYAILALLRLSLAFPACVSEGTSAYAAIKRSFQLTRGAMGRIFLVLLVIDVILYAAYVALLVVSFLLFGACNSAIEALHLHLAHAVGSVLVSFFFLCGVAVMFLYTALRGAALTTALAILYNDQRLRKDGPTPATAQVGKAV